MPCTIIESVVSAAAGSTFATDRDTPGDTPRMRIVQPGGSGDAGLTKAERS